MSSSRTAHTERNFLDVIDKVHEISSEAVDPTHVFTLSQVYEGLLLKMGERGNDGGQFFTPREVIRAIVRAVAPKVGEAVYDPACGTGGFLAQSYEFMRDRLGASATADQIETLKRRTVPVRGGVGRFSRMAGFEANCSYIAATVFVRSGAGIVEAKTRRRSPTRTSIATLAVTRTLAFDRLVRYACEPREA